METNTDLRSLEIADHDAVFAMMAEPEAVVMAAFTAGDPNDRAAFDAQVARVVALRDAAHWAVVDGEGTFVGTIAVFPSDEGHPEVTYWIAQRYWGLGHASRALDLVLARTTRPVLARVARDNLRSRRVLEKSGFEVIGSGRDYAAGRRAETDEVILRLA